MKNSKTPAEEPDQKKPNFLISVLFSEGGLATLIILPIVIYYYFRLAI